MALTSSEAFTEEQLNYFRICHVSTNDIPGGLRKVFKQEWDARYKTSHDEWNDSAKNGIDFYSLIPAKEQKFKAKELSIIRNGNTEEWDCTCLFYAILYSKCIGKNKLDPKVKKAVDDLRQYRNKYAHYHQSKVTDADFQSSIQDVINAFDDLKLDTNAVNKLKSQTSFQTDELQKIQEQLDKERRRNQEPQTFCELPPKPTHDTIPRSSEVDAIMKEMRRLQNNHPNELTHVYLSGNPGCGKSETARQVGEKFFRETASASTKTFVFTLNASSVDTLLRSYINFSRLLRIDEDCIQSIVSSKTISEDKILHFIDLVNPKLALFSSWLVIVDNVVDLKKSSMFFPLLGKTITGNAQILVTTQDGQSIPPASLKIHHQSLSEGMKPGDAVNALCAISQQYQDKDVVFEVAKALDYQPLAIACTAVYMKLVNQCGSTFTWPNCLTKVKEGNRGKTEKPYLDTNAQVYSQTMTTAVKMAVDRVTKEDKVMMFVFQILSVLAQDPIPIEYVAQYVSLCMPEEDEKLIEAHIARSSLVLISDDGQDIRLHQIVFAALQEDIRRSVAGDCLGLANVILSFSKLNIEDDEEPDYDFIISNKSLNQHFVTLQTVLHENLNLFMSINNEMALEVAKCISCCMGKICHMNGKLNAARKYFEMSISIKENCCTKQDLLTEQNALGEILFDLQEHKKARLHFEQAVRHHNCDSHDINKTCGLYLLALTNLGMILSRKELGEKLEAEKCVKEALRCIDKMEQDFPFAGKTYNNIAMVYYFHENYVEAKTFMQKSLSVDKMRCGDNHPFLYERYNDLAIVLNGMGEHNTAKEYLEKALFILTHTFDKNHPHLSICYNNLGTTLRNLRQYDEAKKCMERSLAIAERSYDHNHPTLAIHLNTLGLVLRDLRQYEEAKKCIERAIAIDECAYDDNHPTLAIHLNNLGLVLRELRKYEEAKKYMERSIAIDERVYDHNHPTLAIHLNYLGMVLKDLGEFEEAKKCIERAIAIDERVYDDNHPTLAIHLNSLGLVLRDLRQFEEAKKCMERAVAIDERVYKDNHPRLATHLNGLGLVLRDLRQFEEAKKCMERAVAIDERVYKNNHPTLATHLNDLGLVLKDLRQFEEAKKCMERALATAEQVYDDNHPALAVHLNSLGLVLKDLKQYEEAKKCMEKAVAIDEHV